LKPLLLRPFKLRRDDQLIGLLAFGLGARTAVTNIIAAHYLRQIYRVGHSVKVGDVHGKIVEITNTAVILECTDGRAVVMGRRLRDSILPRPT